MTRAPVTDHLSPSYALTFVRVFAALRFNTFLLQYRTSPFSAPRAPTVAKRSFGLGRTGPPLFQLRCMLSTHPPPRYVTTRGAAFALPVRVCSLPHPPKSVLVCASVLQA
eukprot:4978072-Pleurochrysis_carterae.AAC.2